jgi:hypothetical protein
MVLFWIKHTTQISNALVRYRVASRVAPGQPNLQILYTAFNGVEGPRRLNHLLSMLGPFHPMVVLFLGAQGSFF